MKAILEFNLPEDSEEHETALNGYKYKLCWDEFRQIIRARHKYESQNEFTYDDIMKLMVEIYEEYRKND